MRELPFPAAEIKGFLDDAEGTALYDHALAAAARGPALEIGSYCGKSTLWLGTACQRAGTVLFAVDHHRGSEEHQPGEGYHDPALYDSAAAAMDSLPVLRATLRRAGLEETVIPIVASSAILARLWTIPLGFVFIDGGHSQAAARADWRGFAPHIVPGGVLAIHDIFLDPTAGGQAPHEIYRMAIASGLFAPLPMVRTLGLLRRLGS